jgi:hypothetical protein
MNCLILHQSIFVYVASQGPSQLFQQALSSFEAQAVLSGRGDGRNKKFWEELIAYFP